MSNIFEYLINNHDKLLYTLAGISLMIELGVMGLSGPLLFFAIACAITGVLVDVGLISGWEIEVFCVGMIALFATLMLWKPLKRLQGREKVSDTSSDMIGQVVLVSSAITVVKGKIRHSGINWNARLDNQVEQTQIDVGQQARITGVDGTTMIVVPAE